VAGVWYGVTAQKQRVCTEVHDYSSTCSRVGHGTGDKPLTDTYTFCFCFCAEFESRLEFVAIMLRNSFSLVAQMLDVWMSVILKSSRAYFETRINAY
jgi:hypothetical protein